MMLTNVLVAKSRNFAQSFYFQRFDSIIQWLQVFGFITKPLISYLIPRHETIIIRHGESAVPKDDLNVPLLSFEESTATNIGRAKDSLSLLIERPISTIHSYWRKFDDSYMRPIFGGPVTSQSQC